jgi:hypothetical protein
MSESHPVPTSAVELTEEEHDVLVQQAHAHQEQLTLGLRKGREAAWQVAEAVSLFYEERGWELLGYDSLPEWLAQPEISMPKTTFYRYRDIWNTMKARQVDASTLARLDQSKMAIVLPALRKGRVSTQDAIADVEALAASDLREKYVQPRDMGITIQDIVDRGKADEEFVREALARDPGDDDDVTEGTWSDLGPSEALVDSDPSSTPPSGSDSPEAVSRAPQGAGYVTRSGRVLTDDDIEALADEAEHGHYDLNADIAEVISGESISPDENGNLTTTPTSTVLGTLDEEEGVDRDLAVQMAQILWRIGEEVAPREKKKMSNDLREEVMRVLRLAVDAGLLDVQDAD